LVFGVGIQGNKSRVSCSKSENVETIVILVTLPMTKAVFLSNQDRYIASVAATAGVLPENIKIVSIDEISTRSSRIITARLLLATSVIVQTSVLIAVGQKTSIKDQSILNSNLNGNGLPSGTLVVQDADKSVADVTTPVPWPIGLGAQTAPASAASPNVQIYAIIGGTVGLCALIAITFLVLRLRKKYEA
jgi:hypothetical protein